ncbi:conserved hypothetical protein [Trichinella spiralis]|uniref:hypothetical protein n=1 Tax=Trichinella spiralis TaxID=6334 RepID=UPI0001EFC875|nr:conserved hypothetical protein [Trichinella spiralis]
MSMDTSMFSTFIINLASILQADKLINYLSAFVNMPVSIASACVIFGRRNNLTLESRAVQSGTDFVLALRIVRAALMILVANEFGASIDIKKLLKCVCLFTALVIFEIILMVVLMRCDSSFFLLSSMLITLP